MVDAGARGTGEAEMSGIAGVVQRGGPLPGSVLDAMAASLRYVEDARVDRHAGERAGLVRVYHEATNAERQPVHDEGTDRSLLFWGELFGLEPAAGTRFTPAQDARTALHLMRGRDPADALAALDGSFCLAVLERDGGALLLASDRFNSRPLFYAHVPDGSLVFATHVPAVLADPRVSRAIDRTAAYELFHFQRVLGTRTLQERVRMLPPGSVLRWQDGAVQIRRWFEMTHRPDAGPSEDDWVEAMAAAMRTSLDRITRPPHRIAILLSGGLDSRMVLAAAERPPRCFSFGDFENREFETARAVAAARGLDCTFVQRAPHHYTDLLDRAVEIGAGMYNFNHAHTIGLTEPLRAHCDFVLHGFAPELYFRGTNWPFVTRRLFGVKLLKEVDRHVTPQNLADKVLGGLKYSLRSRRPHQLFRPERAPEMEEAVRNSVEETLAEAAEHSDDVYDRFIWADTWYHSKYPSFLFEASIRPFIGDRSIVFHNHVLDLFLRMPSRYRGSSRVWARAVARLHPGIAAVPDANTDQPMLRDPRAVAAVTLGRSVLRRLGMTRSRRLPSGQAERSWPRFQDHIRHHGRLQARIEAVLASPEALDPSLFDVDRAQAMYREHQEHRGEWRNFLFLLLTYGIWNQRFGPGSG